MITFWDILFIFDLVLFVFMCMTVCYMGFFSLAALFYQHDDIPKARTENRFIVLIPAYKNGKSAEATVQSILGQSYPQRLFDVTVIADHLDEMSNFRLAQQPVTLLTPNFKKSSRAKSLQLAVNNLPQFKIYDIVVILNPGSIVEPTFLAQMNDAYEAAGTKAIQVHTVSQNRDTAAARLSAVFEEINNSIFRRGHVVLGLSASSAGAAMAFDFQWFKSNIMTTTTAWDDKALEILLIRQHIYVDYFDSIMVFEEKKRTAEDFGRQRSKWLMSQVMNVVRNFHHLPVALLERNYNLVDKILQWMLIPRLILMPVIMFMGVILPFIYFTLTVKWWILFAAVLFIFALATPNYLVDDKWDKTFFLVPLVLLSAFMSAKTPLGKRIKEYANRKL